MSNKIPKPKMRGSLLGIQQYGGPGRGSRNKFPSLFYLTARYLNCEHCGNKVYSSKTNSTKVSLMLRHWRHHKACKKIRAERGVAVDQYISEDSIEWEDVPNLDNSAENSDGCEQEFIVEQQSEMDEPSVDVRPLFSDGKDPTGDALYPAVTTDKLKFSEAALRILGDNVLTNDPYLVDVKSDIAEIQRRVLDKFDPTAEPPLTFRNRTQKGSLDDVNPSDLIDILEFGIEVGLSNSQGDKLIALIKRLFGRRKINIQLRNEYESMKRSLSTNVTAPMFPIQRFVFPLPVEYFGDTDPATGAELKAIECVALDPMNVLAESLLRIKNPRNFLKTFDAQLASFHGEDGDIIRVEEIPREQQILRGFSTSNLWRNACADARRYRCIDPSDTRRIVHLMLGVWGDVACLNASKTKSEGGVYMSILNTTSSDYKMHFIGYAPVHFPYTNDKLKSLLIGRGFESDQFNKEIIATTKKRAMRAYIAQIFDSLCSYGRNCFLVQIGKGREAETVNAIVNVVQLGGDGEHCDGLLQIHHGRYANCRICLDNRHSKFCRCDDEAEMRDDAKLEDLCIQVQEVTEAKATSYAARAAASQKPIFIRSAAQQDIETKARDCGVGTSASSNPLYRLFWYWNSRGIYSLHRSATPDLLHAILKGIIEKTVTWALMIITSIKGMDVYKDAYKGNMTLLDDRSRFFKVMGWSMNLRYVRSGLINVIARQRCRF